MYSIPASYRVLLDGGRRLGPGPNRAARPSTLNIASDATAHGFSSALEGGSGAPSSVPRTFARPSHEVNWLCTAASLASIAAVASSTPSRRSSTEGLSVRVLSSTCTTRPRRSVAVRSGPSRAESCLSRSSSASNRRRAVSTLGERLPWRTGLRYEAETSTRWPGTLGEVAKVELLRSEHLIHGELMPSAVVARLLSSWVPWAQHYTSGTGLQFDRRAGA